MRIAVISGSRADYCINKWILKELNKYNKIDYISIEIQGANKYEVDDNINHRTIDIEGNNIFEYSSYLMLELGLLFQDDFDAVIVLGDRWEILQVCIAATYHNIPVIHLGGGEVSKGSYDNDFRDCISRLSSYHFVVTENCKKNLNKIGITDNIYVAGSPRMDYKYSVEVDKDILTKYGLDKTKKTAIVIYHPETKDMKNIKKHAKIFFRELSKIDLQYIIISPNFDIESQSIVSEIQRFKKEGVYKSHCLPLDEYLSAMSCVDLMIGNSSAGIMETPTFRIPFVNVGNRQEGRERSGNVIDCGYHNIKESIDIALRHRRKLKYKEFGDGRASERIVEIIRSEL